MFRTAMCNWVCRSDSAILSRLLMIVTTFGCCTTPLYAQKDKENDPLSFDRNISGLLRKYCYRCHNESKSSGDVNLEKDTDPRLIFENTFVWESALSRIAEREMPPEDSKQPSDEERVLLIQFLKNTLGQLNCDAPTDPGSSGVRRLNRSEYNNSIRFLTGMSSGVADSFASDTISYGFDNNATSLTLAPLQVEQYYEAAKKVVDAILSDVANGQPGQKSAGYQQVFFQGIENGESEEEVARAIILRFANRAFRKIVEKEWIDRLLGIYRDSRQQQINHDQAIGNMLTAVLISPRFLIRVEDDRLDLEAGAVFPVGDFDLASRLSFFLWSSPPDETLLKLAVNSELHIPEVLLDQVKRMLVDPNSDAIIANFFEAWLQFGDIKDRVPNKEIFPDFDDSLLQATIFEPLFFLREVIRKDRPITDLIDANYTYLNARLAKHYGIEGVTGDSMARVELHDRRRGGLLTSAALLLAQSDPSRTNVPRRGNFIAGAILGTPSPPPPPNIPELEELHTSDKPMTLRERLAVHRSNPQCASCHDKMDPLGFGFENYDATGAWRDSEVGKPVDASGVLPSGATFTGPVELKDILISRKDDFAKTLASQLLIYALGRGPIVTDKCVVESAIQSAKEKEYRFSEFVRAIVLSYPFLNRKNPEF